jgi:hypothetical protein
MMIQNQHPDSPKQFKAPPTRPTIAYLTLDLSPYQTLMWSGTLDVVEVRDVNLISFIGSHRGNSPDFGS